MATVIIPTPLRKFTNNASKLSVQAASISELLVTLTKDFPALQKHLLDASGKVPSFIIFSLIMMTSGTYSKNKL